MPSDDKNELEKVQEEHCERVFERYEAKSKSFQRLFSGLVGFSLVFSFFVLFPYVSIQSRNYKIAKRLENLPDEINQKEKFVNALRDVQNGIEKLREKIKNAPETLRSFIQSLEERSQQTPPQESFRQSPMQQQLPNQFLQQLPNIGTLPDQFQSDPCNSLKGEEWVNCKVGQEVERQFGEYSDIINKYVDEPLQELIGKATLSIDLDKLREQLNKLQSSFEKKLAKEPLFWKTFPGKVGLSIELDEEIKGFWGEYGNIVETESGNLEQELKNSKNEKNKLEKEQDDLKAGKDEISSRLEKIESPLGKFPVGLNESVLVFPIVLAIWFLFCTSFFCEAIRLRKVFHDLYQKKDPEKTILTDSQITLVAPLWIDPANLKQNKTLKLMVLLTPFVFFVVAIGMIFHIRTISYDFAGTGQLNYWVYVGLYVLSSGLFIYGYWQIKTELRRYTSG